MDIYKPTLPTGAAVRPSLVIVHGGGWSGGNKTDVSMTGPAGMFASLGFAVAIVNYTLDPANPQTPITDILNAVQFLRTNSATYNLDSSRIGMLGMSAGGHLGLMACIQGTAGTTRPDAMCGWSPPCDLGGLTGDGATFAAAFMNVAYSGNEAAWNAKSPRQSVTSACCPVRIVGSASEDVNAGGIAQSQYNNMETAAQSVGVNVTKRIITGTTHADFGSTAGANCDVFLCSDWLKTKLGGAF